VRLGLGDERDYVHAEWLRGVLQREVPLELAPLGRRAHEAMALQLLLPDDALELLAEAFTDPNPKPKPSPNPNADLNLDALRWGEDAEEAAATMADEDGWGERKPGSRLFL